ncbi:hypothetical protein [Cellulomonas sp. S1-8]|uniref:hypothetical protein n=1 Tax=Cellulomonas sp. S1-8 TaxID=2904790 RepID=UPI0022442718|nr:hypothetical protein [Cellulomonas sp. S1-8]UZN02963.1 hypothetical protein OKX07_18220 [Cellulomonas sp. S1-8]
MTTPRVAVSVMAHPRRAAAAADIARACGTLPARVVLDPEPHGPPSTVRTARLAWLPWQRDATHHLVLQDDVLLRADFDRHVTAAVAARPAAALSLFTEWGSFTSHALRIAAFGGHPWARQPDTYLGTQALVMPAGHARAFAERLAAVDLAVPDDHAVHAYTHEAGLEHLVSNPNLVQHEVGTSMVGNVAMGARRATVTLPDDVPLPADWWQGEALTELTRIPSVFWRDAGPSSYERRPTPGAPWTVAPVRPTFGHRQDEVEARVRALLRADDAGTGGTAVGAALTGVAVTMTAQLAVARSLRRRPTSAAAEACAADAARTIAPGGLRTLTTAGPHPVDWPRVSDAFARLARRVETELLPGLDLEHLAADHTAGVAAARAR